MTSRGGHLLAGERSPEPFAIRGVVEGFYGTYYTFPERNDLIRFLGRNGFNYYMYGPKNDRQHRMRWWDPYPPVILDEFAETIHVARTSGVTFCYAISFGTPLDFVGEGDFEVVTSKLHEFYIRGCRAFGVLLDDLTPEFAVEDKSAFRRCSAAADADFCNRLDEWLQSLDEPCTLCVCPTEYHGVAPFTEYLWDLGAALRSGIDLFYTGPEVCSRTISREDAAAFAEAAKRKPIIWDNYPVNDVFMRDQLHVGPLLGRDPQLFQSTRGLLANVMNQEEASKIALLTIADYLADPERYDPDRSWHRALRRIAGDDSYEALLHFAENSLASPLESEQALEMTRLVTAGLASLQVGKSVTQSGAVGRLRTYLTILDESCYHLKNRMSNLALRQNIVPWVETLEDTLWMGRRALELLEALESAADLQRPLQQLNEVATQVQRSDYRIGGTSLFALVDYARSRAQQAGMPVAHAVENGHSATMTASARADVSAAEPTVEPAGNE